MRNPCKECDYYHKENNTCQSKKCCTGGDGHITWIDRLFCKPYKYTADRKTENSSEKPNNCEKCEHWNDTEDGCADRHGCNTEPQKIGYCNECKWFRDKQVCGRCRSKNLYAPNDEPQTERSE